MDKTYCAKSKECKELNCPRHLKGFNGRYIILAEFDCKEELKNVKKYSRNFIC